jgi:hypothetical protein
MAEPAGAGPRLIFLAPAAAVIGWNVNAAWIVAGSAALGWVSSPSRM